MPLSQTSVEDMFAYWFVSFVFSRVLLCSPGWPETHYIDQAVLGLARILLSLPGLQACINHTQLREIA